MKMYAVIDNKTTQEREIYYGKELVSSWPKRMLGDVPWGDWQIVSGRVQDIPDWIIAEVLQHQLKAKEKLVKLAGKKWRMN